MKTKDEKAILPRTLAVFAAVALVSSGLCGANFVLFSRYGYISGPNDPTRSAGLSMFLMATGGLELIGIGVGLVGVIVTLLVALVRWIYLRFSANSERQD